MNHLPAIFTLILLVDILLAVANDDALCIGADTLTCQVVAGSIVLFGNVDILDASSDAVGVFEHKLDIVDIADNAV